MPAYSSEAVISTIASTYLGLLPLFVFWRLRKRSAGIEISKQERYTTYLIATAISVMHFCEIVKTAYYLALDNPDNEASRQYIYLK